MPSAIHSRCKDHSTIASSSQPQPPTLLHQQHAAQATKVLHAHTPAKPSTSSAAPAAVVAPQTAPRPFTAAKRTSTAPAAVPKMSALMTPQHSKSKYSATSTIEKITASMGRLNLGPAAPSTAAPAVSTPSTTSSFTPKRPTTSSSFKPLTTMSSIKQQQSKSMAPSTATAAPSTTQITHKAPSTAQTPNNKPIQAANTVQTEKSTSSAMDVSEPAKGASSLPEPLKNKLSDENIQLVLVSVIWNGMLDTVAIKLLERSILHRCIGVLRDFCPRKGDSAEEVMEKYVAGKKLFEAIEETHANMLTLIAAQAKQSMRAPAKPFKTALYYLYRAMFEEYHEQIPEATTFLEKAISSGAEPRNRVMATFKSFCNRIRELTQQQMSARESLAVGVRRMQNEVGLPTETARDAQALVDLLEEPEFDAEDDDFGTSEDVHLEAMHTDDEEEETLNIDEASKEAVTEEVADLEEEEEEEQWKDAAAYMETDLVAEIAAEESVRPKPAPAAQRPVPASNSIYTPSKVRALSKTPLGKPQRRVVFEEAEEEVKPEVSSFKLVYEASRPSRRTKQSVESVSVVTPVRRSNRIDQPLRAGQSTNAVDLLPESNWSYQPNQELFASGKLVTMSASKSTVRRSGHLVSMDSANDRLTKLNERVLSTPSRMGPARRVPVAFDEEVDEDEEEVRRANIDPTEAQEAEEEVSSIVADLRSMDIPSAATSQSKPHNNELKSKAPFASAIRAIPAFSLDKKETTVAPIATEAPVAEAEEAVEEEEETASFTPARRSTRRAAQSANAHLLEVTQTPSQKKARRQSALPVLDEPEAPTASAEETAEDLEAKSLYVAMRKAALSSTTYGSGYVVTKTPKKTSAPASEEGPTGVEDTPSRRSHRIAGKRH